MDSLQILGPLLISIGFVWGLPEVLGHGSRIARSIGALAAIGLSMRYFGWRYAASLPDPAEQTALQTAWTWLFLITETMAGITSMAALAWMSRRRNRSAEADHCSGSPLRNAPVDVFIATYNEPFEILERTIIAATCIEHTDLRVWVLDDGARPWVQALAEELGALYTEVPPNVPANRLKRLGFLALLCLRVVFQAE